MADRDKYGNYVNDKGVTIKVNTDKMVMITLVFMMAKLINHMMQHMLM